MKKYKKFEIEKFEIAKLTNLKTFIGGSGMIIIGNDDPTTNTHGNQRPKQSTVICGQDD